MTAVLGEGVLSWSRYERIGDRYGSCYLLAGPDDDAAVPLSLDGVLGTAGTLRAEVVEARDSRHIGDLFRAIFPERPEPGEVIELGSGEFFAETEDGYVQVGVRPDDKRALDWMDPKALYRAHDQTVRLVWDPA